MRLLKITPIFLLIFIIGGCVKKQEKKQKSPRWRGFVNRALLVKARSYLS